MNKNSIPHPNPLRLAGGFVCATGAGFGLFAAVSADKLTVNVVGVLAVAAIGLMLAGWSLVWAASKMDEARRDRELAEEIRRMAE